MPVKRISLQLRTKTAEAQSAISDSPSTPPSSSQENSQFKKRDSSVKGRPSRLKPTVPLHMTTRRHKSELESAYIQEETPAVMGSSKSEQIFSISTKRIKISTSEALASDENLKKRARARINGIHNSVPISCAKETSEFHQESVKSTSVLGMRPRGRPPRRPKPSLSIVSNPDITTNSSATSRKGSPFQISQGSQASESLESKSTTSSRAPSETVHLKVPRQKLVDQYHRKQWLAFNFATTEQIRKRQARLQHQYSLLAQLAKKNNTTLIDKSIDILNSISDVDLARTEWVVTILTGLEKAEQARAEQIHFEKKICLMGAFHAYDAERQRIETEYEVMPTDMSHLNAL